MTFLRTFLFLLVFSLSATSFMRIPEILSNEAIEPQPSIDLLWESSGLSQSSISAKAFKLAFKGYQQLLANNRIEPGTNLVIVDFSLPSDIERLAVYDMEENAVILTSLVAHGRNSGELFATSFSNAPSSYQSSLGFYLTAETYEGKHGYSLRLDGLESGFNDNARIRSVVIHGAEYATQSFIQQHGRLGRSLGCPSLPASTSSAIIDQIKEEQVLFIYADNEHYLANSKLLNS